MHKIVEGGHRLSIFLYYVACSDISQLGMDILSATVLQHAFVADCRDVIKRLFEVIKADRKERHKEIVIDTKEN